MENLHSKVKGQLINLQISEAWRCSHDLDSPLAKELFEEFSKTKK